MIAPLFFYHERKTTREKKAKIEHHRVRGRIKQVSQLPFLGRGRGRSRGCPRRAVLTCLVYKTMLCSTYSLVCCLSKKVVKSQFGKRVENGAGQRGIMVNPFLLAYQIGGGSWQVEVAVVMISAKSTNFTLFSSQHNIKGD